MHPSAACASRDEKRAASRRTQRRPLGMADEEFLAFQAEMNQLEGTEAPVTVAVGPRAPQVMVRGPQGPTPVKVKEPVALPQPPSGARLPVSQWPKPDHLVAQIQQDYPGNPMQLVRLLRHQSSARARTKRRLPDARRGRRAAPPRAPGQTPPVCPTICPPNPTARPRAHPRPAAHPPACPPTCVPTACGQSGLHASQESSCVPSGSAAAASAPQATLSAAAAMSLGRLQPGQMPGDGTIKDNGSGRLAQVTLTLALALTLSPTPTLTLALSPTLTLTVRVMRLGWSVMRIGRRVIRR